MDFSKFDGILKKIIQKFDATIIVATETEAKQPFIEIQGDNLLKIATFLHQDSSLYFDFLNSISAHDNGPELGDMEVWYHLTSIPFEHSFILKVLIDRGSTKSAPKIDSISSIWKSADWHEREAYDLLGIEFKQHPDLRRILLPADWEGHPLRKDYEEQATYHGIKVKY